MKVTKKKKNLGSNIFCWSKFKGICVDFVFGLFWKQSLVTLGCHVVDHYHPNRFHFQLLLTIFCTFNQVLTVFENFLKILLYFALFIFLEIYQSWFCLYQGPMEENCGQSDCSWIQGWCEITWLFRLRHNQSILTFRKLPLVEHGAKWRGIKTVLRQSFK